jgi:hypothetical protein
MDAAGTEAVGDAATGGLIARAVEPAGGEAQGEGHGGTCLNCGAILAGAYCSACGQSAHVHRSLSAFWHDLAHGVLHFEGKIWRTLPMLAWRPGDLTRRYIAGERVRFVSPIALFLFSVFLMFAVVNSVGGPVGGADVRTQAKRESELRRGVQGIQKEIAALQAKRASVPAGSADAARLESEIKERRTALTALRLMTSQPKEIEADDFVKLDKGDNLGRFDYVYQKAKENPSLLIYKLQSNAYKYSWLLIPISVPFVWLLFLHRRRHRQYKVYDHIVFVTYSLAFMTTLVVALSLLHAIGLSSGFAVLALSILPLIHMFRQLKGAYGLSTFSALWRTAALALFALLAMGLFLLFMLTLGLTH